MASETDSPYQHNPYKKSRLKIAIAGGQMLFVAFGALVLVPILTGIDPNVAMFTAGVGTLIFQVVTRWQIPIFLGSSFAFIAPILYSVEIWGMPATLGAVAVAGMFYLFLSLMVKLRGSGFLYRFFPPVVVGPVIMVIGLSLAHVAVNMAMGKTGDGAVQIYEPTKAIIVAAVSLGTTMLFAVFGNGWFRLVTVLGGVICGLCMAAFLDITDFSGVTTAAWFSAPSFVAPEWNFNAILFMVPVAVAPAIEHLGDILAISSVVGKDYVEKPGLHRTLMGDGLATSFAALVGGPPNTTYSEVTGAIMLTKIVNPQAMTWAAGFAIALAFLGKLGAVLGSIPGPVMGGIMVLLFGSIAAVGLNTIVKARVNIAAPRNLVIVALALVFGLGELKLGTDMFALQGVSLAAITAALLNFVLPEDCHQDKNHYP
ncbi:uracil-xanthine permease family protein [Parendozoicomonas sp. Alg238-R29]|uniref:uracil-xanthine permease family protein n=1 Tax=Parendozoicomonas sp. Alg238-R29 TaxID=2993446 RepID=UPI00248DA075|nr:uracil-xanthine permease family protein [Parendozoicomonas sp. Alg238-R29]